MIPFPDLSARLDNATTGMPPVAAARELLDISEAVLENWAESRGIEPTEKEKEGFRLLALHRQGAKGEPSFNACRETCREVAYHYNLINADPSSDETEKDVRMMGLVANHLLLFVSGKMQVEKLGEFCCASRPIRDETGQTIKEPNHA